MSDIRSVEGRYRTDAEFKRLVDIFRVFLADHPTYTPTELREAAMLAAVMHEMTHIRPLVLDNPLP